MRKLIFIPFFLIFIYSCSKNEQFEPRELNIYSVPVRDNFELPELPDNLNINSYYSTPAIVVYPNPTSGYFNIYTNGSGHFTIKISNDKGDFKEFDITQTNNAFDMRDEKDGVYCLEVLINNTVYRTSIIKI